MPDVVQVRFDAEADKQIEQHLYEQCEWLEREHKDLHENKIPHWRKLYNGIPAEETRSFPWPNASNVIVQVIGETVDNATARTLGLLWATHPLWTFQNYYKARNDRKTYEMRRRMLEDFMDIVGNQPSHLDLYRVEGQLFTDVCRLGTGFAKVYWAEELEAVITGYDSAAKRSKGKDITLYDGPRVEKLRHEDVLVDPRAQTVEKSRMVIHRRSLYRPELEERAFFDIYDRAAVDNILASPDRPVPRITEQQELRDKGIQNAAYGEPSAEWDIYECYFPWIHGEHKYRLIYSYHKKTRTILRKIFNFMPENRSNIIRAKLGYREDGMYGNGYAFMLERYQEELSSVHNRRGDNETIANLRMLRVSPRARTLDANFELYPGAILVGEKDDIESIPVGDVYSSSYQSESVTLQLVEARAGISPSVAGAGTGGMTKRPVTYSSQGTLAVLQENNSRTGHATSEFRHAHVILGDTLTSMYAAFGVNGAERLFGDNGKYLTQALKDYEKNKLYIPLRASTGSLNREIEKQNAMLMAQVQERHFTYVNQNLQAIASPMIPPEVKKTMLDYIDAATLLHQRIMKDFGYEQPDEYIPDVEQTEQARNSGQGGQVASGQPPVGGSVPFAASGGGGMVPLPSGAGVSLGSPNVAPTGAR